jgi:hypothetical protein
MNATNNQFEYLDDSAEGKLAQMTPEEFAPDSQLEAEYEARTELPDDFS